MSRSYYPRLVDHGVEFRPLRSPTCLLIDRLASVRKGPKSQRISARPVIVSHPKISPAPANQPKGTKTKPVYYKSVGMAGDVIPRHAYIHEPSYSPWTSLHRSPSKLSRRGSLALNGLKNEITCIWILSVTTERLDSSLLSLIPNAPTVHSFYILVQWK